MSNANVNRWVFSSFLKSVMSETVRELAGRKFHAAGPDREGEGALSELAMYPFEP